MCGEEGDDDDEVEDLQEDIVRHGEANEVVI